VIRVSSHVSGAVLSVWVGRCAAMKLQCLAAARIRGEPRIHHQPTSCSQCNVEATAVFYAYTEQRLLISKYNIACSC
jgi:hypothetical protein